jgi:hypothetical protein
MRVTRELDVELVLGGHGGPITDHRALIDERLAEQEARAEQLLLLLERRPASAHELATELWHDVALTQTYLTLSEVLGHLDLLLEDGRAVERDDGGRVWYEAA